MISEWRPSVIVADPPWAFSDKLPGPGRGAEKHYSTLGVQGITDAIHDMLSGSRILLADDATLLLWRVASMQQEALDVVMHLGFTVKSEIVWIKRTVNGKRHFGMGRQVRAEHEVCLICTRGKGATRKSAGIRSTFTDLPEHEAPYDGSDFASVVFSATATRTHSEKPESFFGIVEALYEGPYVELFARRRRHGWTCLGLEVTKENCLGNELKGEAHAAR